MPQTEQQEIFIRDINKSDIVVLHNVHRFPAPENVEFSSPHLVISINHSGTARAVYDMKEVTFSANDIAVVMPNHLLCPLYCSDDYDVTLLVVSQKFFGEIKHRTLSHDLSKFHLAPASVLTDEQMRLMIQVISVIDTISKMPESVLPHRREMLIYQLNVAIEILNSYRREQDKAVPPSRNRALFNEFCDLLATHYRQAHDVAFYADLLHLTPKYFSKLIHQTVGVTASEWIEEYIATQAKNILATRKEMSVQQVAYFLGFNELSAFCRFFKRTTGYTPKGYKTSL